MLFRSAMRSMMACRLVPDIRKGDTVFCRAMYLEDNLKTVSKMPENTFEEIIKKYVERI